MTDHSNMKSTLPSDKKMYYETVASQEEVYLEKIEEESRMILIAEDSVRFGTGDFVSRQQMLTPSTMRSMIGPGDNLILQKPYEEQLFQSAEELVTGDSDDAPLSEESIEVMLRPMELKKLKK